MKNILFLLLILLLSLILIRCTEKSMEAGNPDRVFTQPVEWKEKFKLSEYVEDFEILTFHNNDSILLSSILRLQIYDQRIYIRCWERGVIFVFDRHLNHVINIRPSGSGPLEFSTLTDYYIDYPQHLLYVLDGILGKVVEFKLESFTPIREFSFKELNALSFTKTGEQFVFLTGDRNDGIIKFWNKKTNEWKFSNVKDPKSINLIKSLNPFFNYQEQSLLGMSFADTIYQISKNALIPLATVGMNETAISSLDYEELNTEFFETFKYSQKTKKTYIPIGNHSWLENMLIVPLGMHFAEAAVIINLNLHKSVFFRYKSMEDFHLYFYHFFNILDKDDEGYLYSYVMPNRLFLESTEKTIQEQKTTPLAKYLTSFIEQFPEEDWG